MTDRTLVVTNDFPPRRGGIQSFVYELAARQPPDEVVVFAPQWRGADVFDLSLPFHVERYGRELMLPTPDVVRRARQLVRFHGCTRVAFGATAPLAGMAGALRQAGAERIIGITHGHEAAWAATPGTNAFIKLVGEQTDCVTFLGDYTRRRLAKAMTPSAAQRMRQLVPGVDIRSFHPGNRLAGDAVRQRYALAGRQVIVCVSRLMRRKGQDALIRALPQIREALGDVALLLVGGGPYRGELTDIAADQNVASHVVFTGSVPTADLPGYYAAADVFAMPCRTRNRGWDVEGLGIVYLEAAASGVPVIAGNSGGAPDAVVAGDTGLVVDGTSISAVAAAVIEILADPVRAARMGQAGRGWVTSEWTWDHSADRFGDLLRGDDPDLVHP